MFLNPEPLFCLQLLKLNITARQDIPQFLTATLFIHTRYLIGRKLDLKYFLFA